MPEADTSLQVSFELKTEEVADDITQHLNAYTWIESALRGGWYWMIEFSADNWAEWKDFLVGRDEEPVRYMRLRLSGANYDAPEEWRRVYFDNSRMGFDGNGMSARVYGGDKRLEMLQRARTRAWPATSISSVLRRIAVEYGLQHDITGTARTRDRWQLRQSDWDYARYLAAESAAESGRADTYLWLDDDVLRYGPPNLGASSVRQYRLSIGDSRLDRMLLSYNGRSIDRGGGATLTGVGFDLDAGSPAVFEMGAQAASSQPALGSRLARDPDDGLRVIPTTSESEAGVEERVRAAWGAHGPRYFSLRLDSICDTTLHPGDMIEVQGVSTPDQDIGVFGRYVVLEVVHNGFQGGCKTTALCFRRESFFGVAEPTGSSVSRGQTSDQHSVGGRNRPRTTLVAEEID